MADRQPPATVYVAVCSRCRDVKQVDTDRKRLVAAAWRCCCVSGSFDSVTCKVFRYRVDVAPRGKKRK